MSAPALGTWDRRLALAVRTGEQTSWSRSAGLPAAALLLGCLAGLALSWQAILSEAARDRVYLVFTGLGYTATASAGQDRTGTEGRRPTVEGMAGTRERQSEKPLAVWHEFAAASSMGLDTRSPDPLPLKSLGSPDRLELAEETGLADERAAEVGAPAVAMDITFDVNSSFLPPDAVDALRELVHRLPVTGSASLGVAATVSDTGVQTAEPGEAYKYNRWLAERRVARVRDWLRAHGPAGVDIEAGFLEHDSSRRVVVALRQGP